MFRAKLFIPALALVAGLFASEQSARADVGVNIRIGGGYPAPVYRPAPVVVARPVVAPVVPVYQPVPVLVPQHECYRVFYRDCSHEPWRLYREFHNHGRAHDVADRLRHQGFQAYVAH